MSTLSSSVRGIYKKSMKNVDCASLQRFKTEKAIKYVYRENERKTGTSAGNLYLIKIVYRFQLALIRLKTGRLL